MPTEIIDLLSSDVEPEIVVSPILPPVKPYARLPDPIDFSDELDFLPAPKRRRVTPPPDGTSASRTKVTEKRGYQPTARPTVPTKSVNIVIDDDPVICWSSSPALPLRSNPPPLQRSAQPRVAGNREPFETLSSDDPPPPGRATAALQFSSRTAALLAELDGNRVAGRRTNTKAGGKEAEPRQPSSKTVGVSKKRPPAPISSIEEFSSQADPQPHNDPAPRRGGKLTTPEREDRAREKEAAKVQKVAERAAAKEARLKEKQLAQDLTEVNRARHDKKVSVVEMILRIPEGLKSEGTLFELTEEIHKQLGVDVEVGNVRDLSGAAAAAAPNVITWNVITWKRKHRARFDEEVGHWVPLPRSEVRDEDSHVLVPVQAKHFVQMVQCDSRLPGGERDGRQGIGLGASIEAIKDRWPNRRIIYLIEGLETFMRKSRNSRNRSYQAAARAQPQTEGETGVAATTQRKRKTKMAEEALTVDDDAIEEALLRLQVEHRCLIHQTASAPETAQWIGHFTQHISTIPYRRQQSAVEASFCMDAGQIRTGEDKDDTYVKMLQEIVRVTLPVAYGIAANFPTVVALVKAMKKDGPLFCQDLKKCSNKNGAFTDARIGPALSKRIYKIFMGEDPNSMDV